MDSRIEPIPVNNIDPPMLEREYPDKDFNQLKTSMNNMNQLQNIVVTTNGNGGYQCVSGWTRVRVARELKWKKIIAKIVDVEDDEQLLWGMAENLCRSDLNTIDREHGFHELRNTYQVSLRKLAEMLSNKTSHEWVRRCSEAYKIRQDFGDDWKKVSSNLTTDLVFALKDAPRELKRNIAQEIENGSIKPNVRAVNEYIRNYNKADDELKEKMLKGSNTTPRTQDTNIPPQTFEKLFKQVTKIDKKTLGSLDKIQRKQAIENIKHTAFQLIRLLNISKKDFDTITAILKVKPKDIEERLRESNVD